MEKNTGKKVVTQGKHREFYLGWNVATLKFLHSLNQITGLKETTVRDEDETMKCLEDGSQGRTTGATAMNSTSSRSHAIFTIHIDRTNKTDR